MRIGRPVGSSNTPPSAAGQEFMIHETEATMANEITEATKILAKTRSLPRAAILALTGDVWSPAQARLEFRRDGLGDRIEGIAVAIREATTPADPLWLSNRLSTLWLAMCPGRTEEQATAWLHETQRLLRDIPSDILAEAVDDAVKASSRGFLPSVGEIRLHADPALKKRMLLARRMEAVLSAPPESVAPAHDEFDPATRCTPEEAAAVKSAMPVPPPVDPITRETANFIPNEYRGPRAPQFDTAGMTVGEIFAKRDELRARMLAAGMESTDTQEAEAA